MDVKLFTVFFIKKGVGGLVLLVNGILQTISRMESGTNDTEKPQIDHQFK